MSDRCWPMRDEYDTCDNDIHFLFDTEKWNGTPINKMDTSHIINSALMLLRRADEFKSNYELFLLDHVNGKLLKPVDDINEIAKEDAKIWIKTTPVFIAFTKELTVRNVLSYFDIVLKRIENESK